MAASAREPARDRPAISRAHRSRRTCRAAEMAEVIGSIMDGQRDAGADRRAARSALRMKGETVDEIVGAARAMRARDAGVDGGDASAGRHLRHRRRRRAARSTSRRWPRSSSRRRASRSPSTATARSRRSAGCADVLEALGVDPAPGRRRRRAACARRGSRFCSRPRTTRRRGTPRPAQRELGVRTIFNLLGPLTNPRGRDAVT